MQFRITKENIITLSSLGVTDGSSFNKLLKKLLSDTVHVSVPLSNQNRDYSSDGDYCKSRQDDGRSRQDDGRSRSDDIIFTMLEKIYGKIDNVYDDTQKIVGEIEKKKVKPDANNDMTMSMVWGDKWKKFKECRDRGGASRDSGWEDFSDLVLRTPFNMIQKNIDEGKYILD